MSSQKRFAFMIGVDDMEKGYALLDAILALTITTVIIGILLYFLS